MLVEATVFGVNSALMFLGTAVLLWLLQRSRGDTKLYLAPALITLVAGLAYAVMTGTALGVLPDLITEARYTDWLVTTPLIVYTLGLVAGADRRPTAVAVGADALMILLGYAATLVTGPLRWALFVASSGAFLVVVYYLLTALSDAAAGRPPAIESMFIGLRDLTLFLWVVYPVLWLVGPFGTGTLVPADYHFIIAGLDVTAKVGFELLIAFRAASIRDVFGVEAITDVEAADGGEPV